MSNPSVQRGNVLLVVVVLVAILSILGVTAVGLGARERINAAGKGKVEFDQACANAATAKIFAELAANGLGFLGNGGATVTKITLPDGSVVQPGHIGSDLSKVSDVAFRVVSSGGTQVERDCTNKLCGPSDLGHTYNVTAHCKDTSGRESEIEIALHFAI